MFSKESIILIFLIKIFFIFLFKYNKLNKIFYSIFFHYFISETIGGLILFFTYFENIESIKTIFSIYNIFIVTIIVSQLYINKLICHLYNISDQYNKKQYGLQIIYIITIKAYLNLAIIKNQSLSVNIFFAYIIYLYIYYIFFVFSYKKIMYTNQYTMLKNISICYNIIYYYYTIINYTLVPFTLSYELLFIINKKEFIIYEKIDFIRNLLILTYITSLGYYILSYLLYFKSQNENISMQKNHLYNKNHKVNISIDDILSFYSCKKSFEEIVNKIFLVNILLIIKKQESDITLYNPQKTHINDYNIIINELMKSGTDIISYYCYQKLLKQIALENIHQYDQTNMNDKKILAIMEKYNIVFFYPYHLYNLNTYYIIIYSNEKNIYKITHNQICAIENTIIYLKNFYKEFIHYFYYGNIFFNNHITLLNIKENTENFNYYCQFIAERIKKTYHVTIFSDNNEYEKIIHHNNPPPHILQYAINKISSIEKKNNFSEYNHHDTVDQYTIIQSTINKKKNIFYTAHILPFTLENNQYSDNFNFYYILTTMFTTPNILENNDINFFISLFAGFKCKIIFTPHMESFIFMKLLTMLAQASEYDIYNFNFETDDINIFFNQLDQKKNQKVIILCKGILINNIDKQDKFHKKYIDFIIKNDTSRIKWFIFSSLESLTTFSKSIIDIADYISYHSFLTTIKDNTILSIITIFNTLLKNQTNTRLEQQYLELTKKMNLKTKINNIYEIYDQYYQLHITNEEESLLFKSEYYTTKALSLKKECLKDEILMQKLLIIYKNYSKLATILEVHKSTISRYFKKKKYRRK